MYRLSAHSPLLAAAAVTLAMGVSSEAHAYGTKDAIRDCESHLRSEYSLSDFRDQSAEQNKDSEHHYIVKGNTKIDGKKHPLGCEIKNRHVTSVTYNLRFREANTRLGAKPRHTRAPAKSENSACAYAPEGWLGCAVMARTRLGSGIARDLKTCRTGCGTSFIRKKICVGV